MVDTNRTVYTMLIDIALHADGNSITMYERNVYQRWCSKLIRLSENTKNVTGSGY